MHYNSRLFLELEKITLKRDAHCFKYPGVRLRLLFYPHKTARRHPKICPGSSVPESGVFMKVTLLMAMTADGKIGKSADHFQDWTGSEDKRMFKAMTHKAGVVIMGSKTFDTLGKPLPGRQNVVITRNKSRRSDWPNLIFTGQLPAEILSTLENKGFSHAILCGGATINLLFARANLIDEIVLTIVPKIFGTGLSLFQESIDLNLQLEALERLGAHLIVARYKVLKATP